MASELKFSHERIKIFYVYIFVPENLKVIATFSVGHDHLHLDEIKSRGIRVGTVGPVSSDTVAEYNIGLAIAVSRRFQEGRKCITR